MSCRSRSSPGLKSDEVLLAGVWESLLLATWINRVGDELNLSIGVIEECGPGRHKRMILKWF